MSVLVITHRPKTEQPSGSIIRCDCEARKAKREAVAVEAKKIEAEIAKTKYRVMGEKLAAALVDRMAEQATKPVKPTDHAEETGGFILEATDLLERLRWSVGDDPDNETRVNVRDSDERRFACVRLQEALMWLKADLEAIEKQ